NIPVGRLYLDRTDDEFCILDIALLPQYRNLGIGSYWLNRVIDEAHSVEKTVRIHVERNNPALSLDHRLGFQIIEQGDVYNLMEKSLSS
ncbi:MAG: GNAT family N-acetyltransferase, partial [Pseudomonadota bacterium]|nr:GNAT family N-acetyltransferase [Pseudomonadota bacterium]